MRRAGEFESAAVGNWSSTGSNMPLLYPGQKLEASKEVKLMHSLIVAEAASVVSPLTWSALRAFVAKSDDQHYRKLANQMLAEAGPRTECPQSWLKGLVEKQKHVRLEGLRIRRPRAQFRSVGQSACIHKEASSSQLPKPSPFVFRGLVPANVEKDAAAMPSPGMKHAECEELGTEVLREVSHAASVVSEPMPRPLPLSDAASAQLLQVPAEETTDETEITSWPRWVLTTKSQELFVHLPASLEVAPPCYRRQGSAKALPLKKYILSLSLIHI